MRTLNKIFSQMDTVKSQSDTELMKLRDKAKVIFSKGMDSKLELVQSLVSKVENSKDLTLEDYTGWPQQFARVDLSVLKLDLENDLIKNLLRDYMQENHCVEIDFKNECLIMNQGPAILINDDGDVLDQDSDKWFIKKSDYETEAERNSLIEAYMNKTGCFPSVIRVDRYSNAFYVNTNETND